MRLRELAISYRLVPGAPAGPRPQILSSSDASKFIGPLLADKHVEHFGVLSLDTKRRVIGWDVVSMGTLDACIVHPREVFQRAILHGASAILLAHNHPSGDSTPSADDRAMARRLVASGDVLGIGVLDFCIIAEDCHYSFRDRGELTPNV